MDFIIVVVSLIDMCVRALTFSDRSQGGGITVLRLGRFLRIVRIMRVIRLVRVFRSLRVLIHSILGTLRSLFWALVLLAMFLYTFALVFTQAVSDHLADASDGLQRTALIEFHFGSLTRSMLTLFQAITGGNAWGDLSEIISDIHPGYVALLIIFITFSLFAVLNVMTGHFCQRAIESAAIDHSEVLEEQVANKQDYINKLTKLFEELTDGQEAFTLDAFEKHIRDERFQSFLESLEIEVQDAWTMFKLLDSSGNLVVTIDTFIDGCLKIRGFAKQVGLKELMYETRWMMNELTKFMTSTAVTFIEIKDMIRHLDSTRHTHKRIQDSTANMKMTM